ncbi:MAG: sugar ABC transporter permease [Clostridia bacterium]|nr:sugar ABC transporter permease [Clostridia bacterium]
MSNLEQLQKEMRKSKRRQNGVAIALLAPYVLIFLFFSVIPFIMGFVFSFMQYNPIDSTQNRFLGFYNYSLLFSDNSVSIKFWKSFATMLLFDLVMVPTLIVIPLTLAYLINLHPPGYKFFRAIIYLPSVISVAVMGIIFSNMFAGSEYGFINALFGTNIKWLSGKPFENDILRWVVIFIASIWWQTGTNFVILSGALRNVPKSLYEACEMDGGSRWQSILHVTLPNVKSSIGICMFNTLIGYLGLYGQPYVLHSVENSIEQEIVSPMMFIQYYLKNASFVNMTGYICAAAVVFGLIVMAFGMIERKIMGERKRTDKYGKAYKQSKLDSQIGLKLASIQQVAEVGGVDNEI